MVKKFIIFNLLLLVSCSIKTKILDNKITEIPFDNKVFNNKCFFDKNVLLSIDTSSIYIEDYSYSSEEKSLKKINNIKNIRTDKWKSYYKFYSNGCLNSFYFPENLSVRELNLNPNYNGERGVYYKSKNNFCIDLFTVTNYGFKRDYGIVKSVFFLKGDTLFEKRIKSPLSVKVYVKKKLPKEFLIFKPDW